MKPALLVLAAGMGRRFGGLKQLERVGPSGEFLLEYSIYDAIEAGFGEVVFVIRREFSETFQSRISRHWEKRVGVRIVFQEESDIPEGFFTPSARRKPWGTAHAVRSARHVVDKPFGVINADDFYGAQSFQKLSQFLKAVADTSIPEWCLIGYRLEDTLSEHGPVSRALCRCDGGGFLKSLQEHKKIRRSRAGGPVSEVEGGKGLLLKGTELTSLNLFGFTPLIFNVLEACFSEFLEARAASPEAECLLPEGVAGAIRRGLVRVRVIPTGEKWFGMTYPTDLGTVRRELRERIEKGQYPESLRTG